MPTKEEIFAEIERERGGVADIYAAFASIPLTIKAHFDLNKALMLAEDLPLSRSEREWLAMETSRINQCDYAFQHHKVAFEANEKEKPDSGRLSLLSTLANTLSKAPALAHDLEKEFLNNGFTKIEWLHALKIGAYFNFTNRLALGLNLQLEQDFSSTCR